ncbi:TPA: hypothetical protein ACSP2M_004382, partial [Aeromonas hydrophila]
MSKVTRWIGISLMRQYWDCEGDSVVVIDRLGCDTVAVLTTVEHLQPKGVRLTSRLEGVDFTAPVGKQVLTITPT